MELINLPPQQLPFSKKDRKWRKRHLDWADSKTFFNYSLVRKSVIHKKINYDLLNGKLHMSDLEMVMNPEHLQASYVPDRIQHYPIMNSKLNVLRGEESKRYFDWKVVVTNPNAVSEKERRRKEEVLERLKELIISSKSEEEYAKGLEGLDEYMNVEYQDMREMRGNALMNHYWKEYDMPLMFNNGFMDAAAVGEEMYQCSIVSGEPFIERLNPLKVRIFKSGYSNRIEDADIIVIEDYWSPGKIFDVYGDRLTAKDREYLEKLPDHVSQAAVDSMDNIDERYGFVNNYMVGEEMSSDGFFFDPLNLFSDSVSNSLLPYDLAGNVRVLRVYWKSKRRIKKVKSYDPETGEETFAFYPETYKEDKDAGEEVQSFYINEAWEGTKIGTDIYVDMRPRPIQYNRLSNPSRCHFGIVGSIYNLNESRPYSMVDMMKVYNYYYDVVHDRLNKLLARNWGKLVRLDLAKVPKKWDIDKWLYYAKVSGIAVEDSFREGNIGAATGKLAGTMNNASAGYIDAEFGDSIQMHIQLLEYIKNEMSDVVGISRQREGQISNRETVGGVERATLQSAHITEWIFLMHDDVKKRALECFLETAKIALRGRNKKFQYILPDMSVALMEIDGDEFAEADYGIVVDSSNGTQELSQKLDLLAQAALQNQTLSFSAIMKLYNSCSISEKQRMIEREESAMRQRQQEAQQQQAQMQQQQLQAQMQQLQAQQQFQKEMKEMEVNARIEVARIQAEARLAFLPEDRGMTEKEQADLEERKRQFDRKEALDREKAKEQERRNREDEEIRRKQANRKEGK